MAKRGLVRMSARKLNRPVGFALLFRMAGIQSGNHREQSCCGRVVVNYGFSIASSQKFLI
jgi:hypothetical protein